MATAAYDITLHVWSMPSDVTQSVCPSRCEGDVSRSDSDSAEARNQSGHPILCDEFAAQLVQR